MLIFSYCFNFKTQSQLNQEDKLQREIIMADSILYQSILTFLNQDIRSYVKGGWLLRNAYNIYDKVYKTVVQLQQKLSDSKVPGQADLTKNAATDGNENELSEDSLAQLLAAVSFGYGTLQLSISLVPPKILKIIEFLGFEGDREAGLSALDYTSNSRDMRAPLAMLGVLWYHTILRPFFALDGTNAAAGEYCVLFFCFFLERVGVGGPSISTQHHSKGFFTKVSHSFKPGDDAERQ